ncbi:hypothetical protein ASD45_11450 [Pseudolabrys sp. Root1462]|jgi:hypothetical protein|uniref:hypothetical protein n=1 Tax=Pseudolabrys sp. Root1462 TaxID=1736466 RepID=UPI0007035833|nr:hypothetical protein [Pseudolabrys sp. Root1462]KQZ01394.1 hypothetical protein ASD45_11450 [Pseudolabrys sp. Root1462]
MRSLVAGVGLLASLLVVLPAKAERKMFIIGADANGYGVDRCLVSGAPCGAAAAAAYCHTQNFASAMSYRKVDRDDITGAIPAGGAGGCKGSACDDVVAIVCNR